MNNSLSKLVLGDIHACYYTLYHLLKQVRNEMYMLIQVGDLIDRGAHTIEVLDWAIQNEVLHNAVFLMGNHEWEFIRYVESGSNPMWLKQGGEQTIRHLENSHKGIQYYYNWIKLRPLFFEDEQLLVSHAGISHSEAAYLPNDKNGLLWNRGELKNCGKLQVHGHTPQLSTPALYTQASNSWNIDTGACYGHGLSALFINATNQTRVLFQRTIADDLN